MTRIVPWLVALALFIENLDTTIIGTSIPTIATSLHTDPISLKLALTSYLLSLAIFIPVSGWFADRFGSQRIFTIAISLFTLGSLCCGFAVSLTTLVFARILQGIGGAMMTPVARLILLQTFAKKDLLRATSFATLPALTGPALGPVLGGIITTYFHWRWIFFVNIPFGILGIWLAQRYIKNRVSPHAHPLDLTGFLLFGSGIGLFAFSMESVGETFISTTTILTILSMSLLLLLTYFIYARKSKYPIIDLSLFRVRTFRIVVIGNFLSRCGFGGIPFLLPLFFQLGLDVSPLKSGLLLLPFALSMMVMKFCVRPIINTIGFRITLVVNTIMICLSMLQFSLVSPGASTYLLVLMMCFLGLTISLQFSCLNVLVYMDLNSRQMSQGTSIGSSVQQLSTSFGVALAAITLKYYLGAETNSIAIRIHHFHDAFFVLAFIPLTAIVFFLMLKQEDGAVVDETI